MTEDDIHAIIPLVQDDLLFRPNSDPARILVVFTDYIRLLSLTEPARLRASLQLRRDQQQTAVTSFDALAAVQRQALVDTVTATDALLRRVP